MDSSTNHNNTDDQPAAPPPVAPPPPQFDAPKIPKADDSLEKQTTFVQKLSGPKMRLAVFALIFAGIGSLFVYSSFAQTLHPSLTLSSNSQTVKKDGSASLQWQTIGIKEGSCSAQSTNNIWAGSISDQGSASVNFTGQINGPYIFSFSCQDGDGKPVTSNGLKIDYK